MPAMSRFRIASTAIGLVLSLLVAGAVLVADTPPPAAPQNSAGAVTPGVAPRNSRPLGKTYEQWGAAMLQWIASIPAAANPFWDADGTLTQAANSGKVWFLMGPSELVSAPDEPQTGVITVPAGTSFFFSPLAVYGAGPGYVGWGDDTPEELAAMVASLAGTTANVQIEIDGSPVADVDQYRIVSPVVPLDAPVDSLWTDLYGGESPWTFGAFGGHGLFINPLPPGDHVIHAVATVPDYRSFEITYFITVVPRR